MPWAGQINSVLVGGKLQNLVPLLCLGECLTELVHAFSVEFFRPHARFQLWVVICEALDVPGTVTLLEGEPGLVEGVLTSSPRQC